jgi:hypothetical protein
MEIDEANGKPYNQDAQWKTYVCQFLCAFFVIIL